MSFGAQLVWEPHHVQCVGTDPSQQASELQDKEGILWRSGRIVQMFCPAGRGLVRD